MSSGWRLLTVGALVLMATAGCVEKSKRLSKADKEALKDVVSRTAPNPEQPLDVRFENKVRLLGYTVTDGPVVEGVPMSVTWYWRVDEPMGEGWKVFTHLADAKGESRINMDANRIVRRVYPAAEWKKGDYITDTQEITLPANWDSEKVVFFLGFWNGPHRLHVTKGKSDGQNRAEALVLDVKSESSNDKPTVPRLLATPLTAAIEIDGRFEEEVWKKAQPSGNFVDTMKGDKAAFGAQVKVLYDADNIYFGFQVADDLLKSSFEKADDHLWEQDTVEVMLDPDGDGKNYFEIQVSPRGVVFDTRYDSTREPKPFGDLAWSSQAKAAVDVTGNIDDDEEDVGYGVELAIPWRSFAAGEKPAAPPISASVWRANFFVMDARAEGQRAAGWSPPLIGDFHTLHRFGRLVFPRAASPEEGVQPIPVAAEATGSTTE